jgi:hypothetical protein
MTESFLISLEKNINNLYFNRELFDFDETYAEIYTFALCNIKSEIADTIFEDILGYINKIIGNILQKKTEITFLNRIGGYNRPINILDNYLKIYNEMIDNAEICDELLEFYIKKLSKSHNNFVKLTNKLWKKIVYIPLESFLSISIISLIDEMYENTKQNRIILDVQEYFKIMNSLESSFQSNKNSYFISFFNNYLYKYLVSKLDKHKVNITNSGLLYFISVFYNTFEKNKQNLKKYGLELYIYENYFLTQVCVCTPEIGMLITNQLPVVIGQYYYTLYNRFILNYSFEIDNKIIVDIQNFIYIYLESYYSCIDLICITFLDRLFSNADFEIIFNNTIFIDTLMEKIHKQKLMNNVNLIGFNLNTKNLINKIDEFILYKVSEIETKLLITQVNEFIENTVYKNPILNQIFIYVIKEFLKFVDYNKGEELLIFYKYFLIKRIYKNYDDITKLNLELYFIKNLQKDFDFPILSKMGIILNDTITSQKLFNEYKQIYDPVLDNILLCVETYGIWDRKFIGDKSNHIGNTELSGFTQKFSEFYASKYEKRSLKWNIDATTSDIDFLSDKIHISLFECDIELTNILLRFNFHQFIENRDLTNTGSQKMEMLRKIKLLIKKDGKYYINDCYSLEKNINLKKLKTKYMNFQDRKNKNKSNVIGNEIKICREDYINLFCVRFLKKHRIEKKNILIGLIIKKYNYDMAFIKHTLTKLETNGYIRSYDDIYEYC